MLSAGQFCECATLGNGSCGLKPGGGYVEMIPGSTLRYTCNSRYMLNGTADHVCLANGTLSGATPACEPVTVSGTDRGNPGTSCRAIWADYRENGVPLPASGPQWIANAYGPANNMRAGQVFCDMNTT